MMTNFVDINLWLFYHSAAETFHEMSVDKIYPNIKGKCSKAIIGGMINEE